MASVTKKSLKKQSKPSEKQHKAAKRKLGSTAPLSSDENSSLSGSLGNNLPATTTAAAVLPSASVAALAHSARLRYCYDLISGYWKKQRLSEPFLQPVNAVALGLVDYHDVIKRPMDLGTIKTQLEAGQYASADEVAADVRLVFSNCFRYNNADYAVAVMAKKLREDFEFNFARLPDENDAEKQAEQSAIVQRASRRVKFAALRSKSSKMTTTTTTFAGHSSTTSLSSISSNDTIGAVDKKKRKKAELFEAMKVQLHRLQLDFAAVKAEKHRNMAGASSDISAAAVDDNIASKAVPDRKRAMAGGSIAEAAVQSSKRTRKSSPASAVRNGHDGANGFVETSLTLPSLPSAAAAADDAGRGKKREADAKQKHQQPVVKKSHATTSAVQDKQQIWQTPPTTTAPDAAVDPHLSASLAVNDATPMSYEEKHALSISINHKLTEESLHKILEIIRTREKSSSIDSATPGEIEIDFEHLQASTLRALQHYVGLVLKPAAALSSSSDAGVVLPPATVGDAANAAESDAVRPANTKVAAAGPAFSLVSPMEPRITAGAVDVTDSSSSVVVQPLRSSSTVDKNLKSLAANGARVNTTDLNGLSSVQSMPPDNNNNNNNKHMLVTPSSSDSAEQALDLSNAALSAAAAAAAANVPNTNNAAVGSASSSVQSTPRKTGALDRLVASLATAKTAHKSGDAVAGQQQQSTATSNNTMRTSITSLGSSGAGLAAVDWNNLSADALGGALVFKEQFESFRQRQEAEAREQAAFAEVESRKRLLQHQQSMPNNLYQHSYQPTSTGKQQRDSMPTTAVGRGGVVLGATAVGGVNSNGSIAAATTMSPPSSDTSSATSNAGAVQPNSQNDRLRQRELERERRRRVAAIASLDPQQSACNDFLQEVPSGARLGSNWN